MIQQLNFSFQEEVHFSVNLLSFEELTIPLRLAVIVVTFSAMEELEEALMESIHPFHWVLENSRLLINKFIKFYVPGRAPVRFVGLLVSFAGGEVG